MNNKAVIDVWVADLTFPGYMEQWYRQADEFNAAHPDHQVNVIGCDFRTLPQQIAEAGASGNPPAIAEYYFYLARAARDTLNKDGKPLFTSVEKAIAGREEILGEPVVIDDIISGVRDYYTYHGDLTSMPSVATTSLLFANKELIEAAGITEMPQTWSELEAACQKIADLPDGPGHAITWTNHGTFFQQALAAQGGKLANNDNGRSGQATEVDLTSPEMMNWVKWWKKMHEEGHYLYTGKIPDWEGNLKAFFDKDVAFRITSSNDVHYMVQVAKNSGFTLTVGRFPDLDGAPCAGNAVAGTSLWLTDGLDEATQDGALAFLQFLHNPRNTAERHKANSFIAITNAAFKLLEDEGWFAQHPYHRAGSDQLKTYPAHVLAKDPSLVGKAPESVGALFGDFAGAQDVMTRAMGDVLANGAEPDERFAEATVEAQKLLDDYLAEAGQTGPRSAQSLKVEFFTGTEQYSAADLENVAKLEK
jgi:sn-glycerol 3-phosphate transport system substrate-binding protein